MASVIDVEAPRGPDTPTTPPGIPGDVNHHLANGATTTPGGRGGAGHVGVGNNAGNSVVRKWHREDMMMKSIVVFRVLTCLFSFIAAVVMAANRHGDWKEFHYYQEYRYLVAIGFIAFFYSGVQLSRFGRARDFVPKRLSGVLDFAGDQIMAYLLISAMSAAIPITNRMREGADNMFTDASSAAISMAFFAFLFMAISAIISGYKLSKQNHM